MQTPEALGEAFAMRVGSIDYYLDSPVPGLDVVRSDFMGGEKLQRVPILRIFGATKDGKKACLHLHRCFPYIYVPLCEDWTQKQCPELDDKIHQFASSVEKALRIHSEAQRAAAGGGGEPVATNRQYVLKAQAVRAVPYYGCFLKEKLFVKLVLIDPSTVNNAAALLAGGSIMDRTFQPHNSHLPFILQCMTDLNLVGMGHIRSENPSPAHRRLTSEGRCTSSICSTLFPLLFTCIHLCPRTPKVVMIIFCVRVRVRCGAI
jgi:DNA polymerase zeta